MDHRRMMEVGFVYHHLLDFIARAELMLDEPQRAILISELRHAADDPRSRKLCYAAIDYINETTAEENEQ